MLPVLLFAAADGVNGLAVFVYHLEWRDAALFCYAVVVCTESRSDVNDTCTVFCADVVAVDDAECAFTWVDPWDELFVFQTDEVFTFACSEDFVRKFLVAYVIVFESRFFSFAWEECAHQWCCQNEVSEFAACWVDSLYEVIVDVVADAQCCV